MDNGLRRVFQFRKLASSPLTNSGPRVGVLRAVSQARVQKADKLTCLKTEKKREMQKRPKKTQAVTPMMS